MIRKLIVLFAIVLWAMPTWAAQDVVNTRHNLSVSGPGPMRSGTVTRVCVFCHAPHNASPLPPLWNRTDPGTTYIEYGSSTLNALPGQPTGKSRLCLACHDGTVALGALLNPPVGNDMTRRISDYPGRGTGNLGNDLTDDHPISFIYDAALAGQDTQLHQPQTIDLPLQNGELQCTTCHDPHEANLQPFLRKTVVDGQLCKTCHNKFGTGWSWDNSSHATSTASSNNPAATWPERKAGWPTFSTVASGGCINCHTPHNAMSAARLIKATEENTCYLCHDGSVASTNIQADTSKFYSHPVNVTPNPDHDAEILENPITMAQHAECSDCHNPHSVEAAPPMISFNPSNRSTPHTIAPAANALIKNVKGVDINGAVTNHLQYQYELCFKCHGLPGKSACGSGRCSTATNLQMVRQDGVYNIRDKVNSATPGLVSFHPIERNNPANDTEVPSLRKDIPLNKTSSLIYCTDCHSGDTSAAAGGTGANGPHGSNYGAIMAQRHSFASYVPFSTAAYQICFKCHDQAVLMSDASGFPHKKHLKDEDSACINCHDPHGSQAYPHLINFLTEIGGTVNIRAVSPNSAPIWTDRGRFKGSCTLSCHGKIHDDLGY